MFKKENCIYKKIKKSLVKDENIDLIIKSFGNNQIELSKDDILNNNYKLLDSIEGKIGLYYFEIKQTSNDKSWDNLREDWKQIKNIPSPTKRWEKHIYNENDFFPFYIGKYSGSLKDRIRQHVFATKKDGKFLKSTSALRLKEHYEDNRISDTMNCFTFRVSYTLLELELELLPLIESKIREKKGCMVGKD